MEEKIFRSLCFLLRVVLYYNRAVTILEKIECIRTFKLFLKVKM